MKRIIFLFLLLILALNLSGQLTPLTDQYILNPITINPAYAGNRGALNVAAFYRRQWIGVSGAPETLTLAADAPLLEAKMGLGLIITNDVIGVTKQTAFTTNYSYRINLNKGNLSFGLGAGIITTNTAWSDLVVLDPGDEYYLIDSKVFVVPGFSFGTYYSYKKFFAGFSIPQLVGYKFDFDRNKYSLTVNTGDYNYMFNTGYVFNISPKIKLFPSTLVTVSPGNKLLYDINAHASFIDKFWVGASYRNNRSMASFFQIQVIDQLKVAYTYTFDFGDIRTYSSGSHELMLRYEFKYKVDVMNPLVF